MARVREDLGRGGAPRERLMDVIDSVRVAFYGIRCVDGQTPPNNGLGKLPVGCSGFVTATPKMRTLAAFVVPAAVESMGTY